MNYTNGHSVFIWLKVNHKLIYIKNFESFTATNKEATKHFIKELKSEIDANNHQVVFMLLSLGLSTKKITKDLQSYWNYCYQNRFQYDTYRDLLVQFPNTFINQKYEIYKELGDLKYKQGKGHFIDVDIHLKEAMEYYKKINAKQELEKCLAELQKNKLNIEENFPKPIEVIVPVSDHTIYSTKEYSSENSGITRVTRTSSNNLIYKDAPINEMLELNVIKYNIVANLINFFQVNNNMPFDEFLDYFSFKDCWFYNRDIYKIMLPALFHFHYNFEIDIKENRISMINYVLPLDSLVLKFEGIIRLFLEEKGEIIIVENKEKINENTNLFKMLSQFEESLKNNETEKEKFIEIDKPFFEHIFSSKELNLRNEIAHSFFKKEYYSHEKVIYIIDAISRIGKYQFVKQRKTTKIDNK
jgi:hypothetical protein